MIEQMEWTLLRFPLQSGGFLLSAAVVMVPEVGLAQDVPPGLGDAPARTSGSRLDRVEILSRQPSDDDLRRRAKVAKQLYGREEIDKYGDTNVADVLKRLPGVNMQGNTPRMRGLGAGYTLLLINGDPAPPGFALDQLSPSQIERIEVAKSPTADQSAQAVAGSINIIMKDAPRRTQRDLRLGMRYAIDRPTVSGNFTFGEKWDALALSLPLSVFEWRGADGSVTHSSQPGTDGLPSSYQQQGDRYYFGHGFNLGPRLNWKLSDDATLTWQSFLQKGIWNNRSTYSQQILSGQPAMDDDGSNQGTWENVRSNLSWTNHLDAAQRLELKAGLQASKGTSGGETVRLAQPQRRTATDNSQRGMTQAGNYTRLVDDAHSLSIGWDLEWRQRDETREVTERGIAQLPDFDGQSFSARVERQALYVQDEWEINTQWSTYLGLRGERIATQSLGVDAALRNTSTVLTPMWHLNYKPTASSRDRVRASVTRSYKAPELTSLLGRPTLSSLYPDTNRSNSELSPDRVGNPALLPELATGLDLAYEKYLVGGGLISVAVFYRQIDDLVRSVTSLQNVAWSPVPRWVSQPTNFSKARTRGLELEVKGRAGELLPELFDAKTTLNVRAALSFYQSQVDALPGPDNRLDGQQPWSGTLGLDYRMPSIPVTWGASLAFTPGYTTRQTETQTLDQSRVRTLDVFAQWVVNPKLSVRIGANNIAPVETQSLTALSSGYGSRSASSTRSNFNLGVEMKF
ncbi:MAG: TonB-dependent receptor [Rhodoferax sp.]|nr:TonB-dependent receptor [Rhodoferax sp.]